MSYFTLIIPKEMRPYEEYLSVALPVVILVNPCVMARHSGSLSVSVMKF